MKPRCQYRGLEEFPPIRLSSDPLVRRSGFDRSRGSEAGSGSGFDQAEQQLQSESDDEQGEPRERPLEGEDSLVQLFVGEVEAGKFGAEPGVDSIFSQLAEAEEGIAREKETSEEGEGVGEDAKGHAMIVEPLHGGIVQEVRLNAAEHPVMEWVERCAHVERLLRGEPAERSGTAEAGRLKVENKGVIELLGAWSGKKRHGRVRHQIGR